MSVSRNVTHIELLRLAGSRRRTELRRKRKRKEVNENE